MKSLALIAPRGLWGCAGPSCWLSRPALPHSTLRCALGCRPVWPTFMGVLALWLLVTPSRWQALTRGHMGGEWGKALQLFPFGYRNPPPRHAHGRPKLLSRGFLHVTTPLWVPEALPASLLQAYGGQGSLSSPA